MPRKQSTSRVQDPALAELRRRMRHSTSHVMADAVLSLFPGASFGIGPSTEDGFYYDFDLPRTLTPDDLGKIEEQMREAIAQDLPFQRKELTRGEALSQYTKQPFKLEIIQEIPEGEVISTYRHGNFEDLCAGPHVESTGKIGAFKLMSIAGAYWRGDEHRPMLQRIYGTAFESTEALEDFLAKLAEAERRDHRKLGRQLDLFSIHDEVGPGLVIWHPKGAQMRLVMEDYWRDLHDRYGYALVYTPHVGRSTLWETSGHLSFYKESMFSPMDVEGQQYFIKPMNCPFHIMVYRSALRSYRDLPMRIGELGTVYRYERSGVLHGLMRVRGFTQDDAHIFCRPDQVEAEVLSVLDLTFELLSTFGFHDYEVLLSTRPEKYVGEPEMWDVATRSLERALDARKLDYVVDEGGGAFYGPKIDIKIRDALDRAWQCTTVQFDFNLPERFDLTFQGADGQPHRPYMVHRAIYGSLERFLGVLIEHYAGAFPLWLAPVQAVVIPIADRHLEYAQSVAVRLKALGFRAHVDDRKERMNLKIREAQLQKAPYMLVVGDKEQAQSSVAVRLRSGEDLGAMAFDDLASRLQAERDGRK
ncbi:MAG: threonine--tRNA ligase [Chloroflexota bacterium]|nr:threonine--tRNA ligase [Chloroflexota bacterium]